jgi:two-component system chemotaxis response regulator CheY
MEGERRLMSKTILTVDDSPSIRQMVSLALSSAGYRVIEAVDGGDGYAKAISGTVHAVITDLNMPVMNGIEFIRKFRTHPASKGVPIILLTTESDDELRRQAKEVGAIGWIVKPFKQDQLLAVIKKVAGA